MGRNAETQQRVTPEELQAITELQTYIALRAQVFNLEIQSKHQWEKVVAGLEQLGEDRAVALLQQVSPSLGQVIEQVLREAMGLAKNGG